MAHTIFIGFHMNDYRLKSISIVLSRNRAGTKQYSSYFFHMSGYAFIRLERYEYYD